MKIHIIIGQSGGGKTTYTKKRYLKIDMTQNKYSKAPVYYTSNGSVCLIGKYLSGMTDRRCCGTDTIHYAIRDGILDFVKDNLFKYQLFVAEGDRICGKKYIDAFVSIFGVANVELTLVVCDLKTSVERLRLAGSKITDTFAKTTKTKAANIYEYAKSLGVKTNIHNTEDK